MRKLRLLLVGAVVLAALVGAGPAQARLDPSFGQGGVVHVQPPIPSPWQDQYVRRMAAARDGSSYVLAERMYCTQGNCPTSSFLFRYRPDGELDTVFGEEGAYQLPEEGEGITVLSVDSQGRPLLTRPSAETAVIRRLTKEGEPDPSFGAGGAVSLACQCEWGQTQLVAGAQGSVTVAFGRGSFSNGHGRSGTIYTLVRLESNGSVDRSFGRGGSLRFGVRGAEPFVASAVGKGGALYLAGGGCCFSRIPGYVVRISSRGKVDDRFETAAARGLRRLRGLNEFESAVTAVVARPRGAVDLLGYENFEKGFELRLGRRGHPVRKFGRGGLQRLPLPVASATPGSGGAVMAISAQNLGPFATVMRILYGGRLDRSFGRQRVPDSGGESGFAIVGQAGRRALVLDLGNQECRSSCAPDPKLVRFLEPAPRR
jgi:hypothetical protein